MKINPFLTDETKIAPPTPGAALVRLSQTLGALKRAQNANPMPENLADLASARNQLQNALENGENLGTPFQNAQNALRNCFAALQKLELDEQARGELMTSLGFPDPRPQNADFIAPIDIQTVCVTHFKPQKQVFSTISFQESQGATAYWLFELRYLPGGSPVLDATLENYAPYFSRVRLPVGKHTFLIESRNPSKSIQSELFEIEVPAL